jgi:hypothetical protein
MAATRGGTFRDIRTSRTLTMPTAKPRLQVTLTPRSRAAIARVAAIQSRPASKLVAEILDEATPILEQIAATLEALKEAANSVGGTVRRRLSTAERRAYSAAVEGMAILAELEQDARTVSGKEAAGGGEARARRRLPGSEPDPRPSNTGVRIQKSRHVKRRSRRRQGTLL